MGGVSTGASVASPPPRLAGSLRSQARRRPHTREGEPTASRDTSSFPEIPAITGHSAIFAATYPCWFDPEYYPPTSPARAAVDGDRRGRGRQAWGIVTPRGSGLTGAETVPLTDPRNEILPPARRFRLILIPRGVRASRAPLIFPDGTWAGLSGDGPGHRTMRHAPHPEALGNAEP